MDDRQLIEAIRAIIKEETSALDEKMTNQVSSLREEVADQVSNLRDEMAGEFSSVREDMTGLREEMTTQNRQTHVLIENKFDEIRNLLREDYGRVADAAAKGAAVAESHQEILGTVKDHDNALQNHNKRITVLEGKAI